MNSIPSFGTTPYPSAVPQTQQVVIPQITIPQSFTPQAQQAQQPSIDLFSVKGMDGAKAFPTLPNSRYALFDEDDDVMYIKVTDKNNYPVSLVRYRFVEELEPAPTPPPEYVTMEEFNKFKEEMLNAKQPIRSQSNNTSRDNAGSNGKPANSNK